VQNCTRQICQDVSNFVEIFVLYKLIIFSLAGKICKKSYGQNTKKYFYAIFKKRFAKDEKSLLNMIPNMLQGVFPCELYVFSIILGLLGHKKHKK
jgi:hypothetical protein